MPTLLDDLCKAAKRQGGTIHQYIDTAHFGYESMRQTHAELTRLGITFNSRAALDKLANEYHVVINWQ